MDVPGAVGVGDIVPTLDDELMVEEAKGSP